MFNIPDDDDEDLSTLDRGDDLEAADAAAEADADKQARDDAGRFTKTEDADKDKPAADADADKVADEDADADDEDAAGETGATIPYARFKKVIDQRNRATTELEALKAAKTTDAPAAPATPEAPKEEADPIAEANAQLDDLYEKVEAARADGDVKLAASLQRQIDTVNRDIVKYETGRESRAVVTQVQIDARYNTMLDVAEAHIPEINPDTDEYDPEAVRQLDTEVKLYLKAGLNRVQALTRAVQLLFRTNPFVPSGAKPAAKEPAAKAPAAKEPAAKKPTDVAKAVSTANKQPPDASTRGVTKDEAVINPSKLTDDELEALPASKLAELRGDFM